MMTKQQIKYKTKRKIEIINVKIKLFYIFFKDREIVWPVEKNDGKINLTGI